jgi:DNA repair exonuclease SbcCD nuclease subunit
MTKFIHTGDWHLGMQAHFLPDEARARFAQDRFDAVRKIAQIAADEGCEFVVVAGDVFDSNQVDPRVVERAMDALATFTVPVFLLPGNHDPNDPASIYGRSPWTERTPANVVLIDTPDPRSAGHHAGVEVIGVPWTSKTMLHDPVSPALASPRLSNHPIRVVVGHGVVDYLAPVQDDPAVIRSQPLAAAIEAGSADYVALGDRHSATEIEGAGGRAWYAGAPVATAHGETDPNQILLVTLEAGRCEVERRRVGGWVFEEISGDLAGEADVQALTEQLDSFTDKPRTIVRLALQGTLSLATYAQLEDSLERSDRTFASINRWARHTDLVVEPSAEDMRALDVSGYVRQALDELHLQAVRDDEDAVVARDALNLLYRLAR